LKPADQTSRTTEGAESYERVVAQLAKMPDVIGQLLQDHEADSTGRCAACTKPEPDQRRQSRRNRLQLRCKAALLGETRTSTSTAPEVRSSGTAETL
jgi:hypothetical protein